MSIVVKRAEAADPRNSFSAATFRKVLKGFEIGGLPYTEVQFQLKRLLATGVDPAELREVLRRSELIEPLPEYAHREVQGLLDEAIEQSTALQPEPAGTSEQVEEMDPALLAAELKNAHSALESEQTRAREAEEALSERIAAEEVVRSNLDMALRESERQQAELRAARNSLASRDKVIAQMRQTLDERDAQLEAARGKSQEIERSLTDSNSLSGAARESLALRDKTLAEMRQSLAERDAQLLSLRREHAESLTSLESRGKSTTQLQSELHGARAQAASLAAEVGTARAALESERRKNHKAVGELEARNRDSEEKLQAAHKRLGAAKTDLDELRAQLAKLQAKQREGDARIEKLNGALKSEAKRATHWQAVAQQRDSGAAPVAPQVEMLPPLEILPRAEAGSPSAGGVRAPLNFRGWRWNVNAMPPTTWFAGAIVLLAAALWFVVHRPAAPVASAPAVATPAPIPAGTTIRDCPTCPGFTVLPTGRFAQGSAATENSSAFEKPLHWVMIAHPIAMSTNAVTVDEFRAFVAATGRDMQGCDIYDGEWRHRTENNWENPGFAQTGAHPATCASWNDAKAYAVWLSAKTGQHYRLPSASEWEYAARAGAAAAQPWNADGSGACANANVADLSAGHRYPGWAVFACNDGFVQTSPVGSFQANAFGLNDMLGNVFQWTEDCWKADYKGAPIDGAARMDGDCTERELRGGSWFSSPTFVRANYRNHFGIDYRTSSVGIRLVRDMTP